MYPSIQIGPLTVWTYGLMIGVALCLAYILGEADFKRRGVAIPIGVFLPSMAVAGLIGAKIDYVIFIQWRVFHRAPWSGGWVAFFHYGYTWFGAVLAGISAAVALARLYKAPVLKVLDVIPVALLGPACGRLGCFLAGDGDYGIPTSLPWGVSFPHGIVPTTARVHPTPLYEMTYALILLAILWRRGRTESYAHAWHGSQLAYYLLGAGICRFFDEFLSRNVKVLAGLTEAQCVSVAFVLVAVALIFLHRRPSTLLQIRCA